MFESAKLCFVFLLNGDGLERGSVEAGEHALAGGLDNACAQVAQLLLHAETLVADADDSGLADDLVVEADAVFEVHTHMHQHQVEGGPVDSQPQHVLQVVAPSEVKVMALSAIVDMHERVQVAHTDLDWHGVLKGCRHGAIKKKEGVEAFVVRLESVDFLHQTRLEVGRFILMNHTLLGKLVNHGCHSRQLLGGFVLIFSVTNVLQGITHGLGIITVSQSLFLVRSNSFDR